MFRGNFLHTNVYNLNFKTLVAELIEAYDVRIVTVCMDLTIKTTQLLANLYL